MPAMIATSSGSSSSSTSAFCRAASTPKSPQPGHHHDFSWVLKSARLAMPQHLQGCLPDLPREEGGSVVLEKAVQAVLRQPQVQAEQLAELVGEVVFHHQDLAGGLDELAQLVGREGGEHPDVGV